MCVSYNLLLGYYMTSVIMNEKLNDTAFDILVLYLSHFTNIGHNQPHYEYSKIFYSPHTWVILICTYTFTIVRFPLFNTKICLAIVITVYFCLE